MKTSISQITTVTQSFADDLDAYRAAGADAIGIWEMKLDGDSLERFRASGLGAAAAVPANSTRYDTQAARPRVSPVPRLNRRASSAGVSGDGFSQRWWVNTSQPTASSPADRSNWLRRWRHR